MNGHKSYNNLLDNIVVTLFNDFMLEAFSLEIQKWLPAFEHLAELFYPHSFAILLISIQFNSKRGHMQTQGKGGQWQNADVLKIQIFTKIFEVYLVNCVLKVNSRLNN